jgi:uncharacterized protein (TIGR03437 family)
LEDLTLKTGSLFVLALVIGAAGARAQQLTVDQTSLALSAQYSGPAVSKTLNIGSSGAPATFFWTVGNACFVSPGTPWLKPSPQSGTTPSALTVTADPTGLQAGTYNGCTLTIFGGTGTSVTVPVTFTVAAVGYSPSSVPFTYTIGGAVPSAQNVTLTGQSVSFTAAESTNNGGNWLVVSPPSGTTPSLISVQLNPTVVPNLAAGTYTGTVTVTPATPPAISIPVTLTVSPAPPVTVSSTSVSLGYQVGGTNNSPSQVLTLSTTGAQALNYSLTSSVNPNPSGRNWIVMNPTSGQIPAGGSTQVTISYDTTANLPASTTSYTGTITVFTPGGAPTQQNISVSLLVSSSPLLIVPTNTLSFLYELAGSVPAAHSITPCSTSVSCTSASGQASVTLTASTTSGSNWLAVTPPSGTTGMPYSVSVNPANLALGNYTGTVAVNMPGAANSPQNVTVNLTVANDPVLQSSVNSIAMPYQLGQSTIPSQTVAVSTSTGAPLNYTAVANPTNCGTGWLLVNGNATGTTPNTFTVTVNPTGLSAGPCTGTIAITGTVPSTGAAAINSVSIPVTLTVSANPLLTIGLPGTPPAPPFFTAQQGGNAPAQQNIALGSTNPATTLNYSVVSFAPDCPANGAWLLVAPQSGTTAAGSNMLTVAVTAPGLLSAGGGCGIGGAYTGKITITATNPGGQSVDNATAANPIVIPVTYQITAGTLTLSSTTVPFTQALGGTAPSPATVNVTSTGAAFSYNVAVNSNNTVSWLSATPASGTTPGAITISADGSKLTTPGLYTGYVTVTAPNAGGSPAIITVNLTVTPGTISAPATPLNFSQIAGGSAPAAQTVAVTGTPSGLNFSVAATMTTPASGTWLTATVGSGTATTGAAPANVVVSVNAGSLSPNTYTGTVTITSTGATGSPITIPVNLTVTAAVTLTAAPTTVSFPNYVVGTAAPAAQNVQLSASASAPFTATAKTTDGGSWLTVTPASGTATTTAQAVSVGINTTGLKGAGTYTGTITFSSPSALAPATVNVTLTAVSIPAPVISGLQNDASYTSGAVAPGENIVIYGTGIGPATTAGLTLTSTGTVSTNVGGTQVFFDTTPAPIIYTGSGQTSVMVPHEVAGRTSTQITVVYQGVSSAPLTYNVAAASPGIYTQNSMGSGPGSIVNYQDGSVNGPAKGVAAGSYIYVYLTGTGETSPALVTGAVNPANGTNLKNSLITYTATIAGVNAPVLYQGTAPGFVEGVMQFNIQVPAGIASGPQPIVITGTSGGITYSTQPGVTVQVQ